MSRPEREVVVTGVVNGVAVNVPPGSYTLEVLENPVRCKTSSRALASIKSARASILLT